VQAHLDRSAFISRSSSASGDKEPALRARARRVPRVSVHDRQPGDSARELLGQAEVYAPLTRNFSIATGSMSDPTNRRPIFKATAAVVPPPTNGSKTSCPGEANRLKRSAIPLSDWPQWWKRLSLATLKATSSPTQPPLYAPLTNQNTGFQEV
jgi:hypothetical protein